MSRETFAEFVERIKPKNVDKFKDTRGIRWVYRRESQANYEHFSLVNESLLSRDNRYPVVSINREGKYLIHDFIEPVKPKLLAQGLFHSTVADQWNLTTTVFSSLEALKSEYSNADKYIWPAIPNDAGFYEVTK